MCGVQFITKTYQTATPSISINGLDSLSPTSSSFKTLLSTTTTNETIEYEPYDAHLAARLSSLYAQLESLTTTVAQMRRDAPAKAARGVAEGLLGDDFDELDEDMDLGEEGWEVKVPGIDGMGEMEDVYEEAVRTLLRLQGEGEVGNEEEDESEESGGRGGTAGLATTVGKVERAGRAAEVVEKM